MNSKYQTLDDLMDVIGEFLPERPAEEILKNLRAALSGTLDRMDLVTREEFDVQKAVLQRSRERLQQLEQMVAELEKNR